MPLFESGTFIVSLPSPYQSVLGINDFSKLAETAFGQHSRRGVGSWKRVGSNHAHLSALKSITHQHCRSLCGVTFALVFRCDSVGDLDRPVGPLKPHFPMTQLEARCNTAKP